MGEAKARKMLGVSVKYVVPDGMPLTYANQMSVAATDIDVVVSFFQSSHPVEFSDAKTVPAHCVSRIVLTPAKASELLDMLSSTLDLQRRVQEKEGG